MLHVKIKVHERDNDEPTFPEYQNKTIVEGKLAGFGIMENGMQSGNTSVAFFVEMPDGSITVAQVSAGIMDGLAAALRGAEERFSAKKTRN